MWMCNFILTHFATPLSVLFFSEEYFNGLFYTKTNMMKSLRVMKHFVRSATLRGWYQNKTLSDTEFPKTPYKAINSRTHYNDVIMNMMASQITCLTIVYSTVYSRRRSRKTSKLGVTGLCGGIHRWPVNSPHKGPVRREMFPFDDVIMYFCLIWAILRKRTAVYQKFSVKDRNSNWIMKTSINETKSIALKSVRRRYDAKVGSL